MQIAGRIRTRAARSERDTSATLLNNKAHTPNQLGEAIPFSDALAAFSGYFTPEGQAELHWIVERDFTRELHGPISPIVEIPPELYLRFTLDSEFANNGDTICSREQNAYTQAEFIKQPSTADIDVPF